MPSAEEDHDYIDNMPDDILVTILIQLPVDCISNCRCVCKRWKALTSSWDFVKLHCSLSRPTILVDDWEDRHKMKISLLDTTGGERNLTKRKIIIHKLGRLSFLLAMNNFLVFSDLLGFGTRNRVLLNLLTQEKMRLSLPPYPFLEGHMVGIYVSPTKKDQYSLLWHAQWCRPRDGSLQYSVVSLGGAPCWRKRYGNYDSDGDDGAPSVWYGCKHNTGHCSGCWRELSDDTSLISYGCRNTIPVIVDYVLYWMVELRCATSRLGTSPPGRMLGPSCAESIMAFDTRTEKFSAIPHPGDLYGQRCKVDPGHQRMHLSELGGGNGGGRNNGGFRLCLCDCSLVEPVINVWVLRNDFSWFRWHKLDIDFLFNSGGRPFNSLAFTGLDKFTRTIGYGESEDFWLRVKLVANGEAYVKSYWKSYWKKEEAGVGLYVINLQTGGHKRLTNSCNFDTFVYNPCLVSVGNTIKSSSLIQRFVDMISSYMS